MSLVVKPCDTATNNIKIGYHPPETKKDFAVCVKGLDFPYKDISVRLVEWIELLLILGAEKIYFYNLQVHPRVEKTLKYLQSQGKVDFSPFNLPGHYPNQPLLRHLFLKQKIVKKRQIEVVTYNDCFYKHMNEYKYVVLLDTDEVIIPQKGKWKDLLEVLTNNDLVDTNKNSTSSCFYARNAYFLDPFVSNETPPHEIPEYMHILRHVYRTQNFTKPKYFVKSFHSTQRVLTLHNHFPLHCLNGACYTTEIPTDLGYLHHYREDCVSELKTTCEKWKKSTVRDDGVWRFKAELIRNVEKTLRELGILTSNG